MSWTKVIICDICGKQHKFWKSVGMERDLICGLLKWGTVHVGRSVFDVCAECKGDADKKDLIAFFKENPVDNSVFSETLENAIVKGWNHNKEIRLK